MLKTAAAVLMLTALTGAAQAQSMTVAQFLSKAEALEKKGAMALFSRDIGVLKREIRDAGSALRERQKADLKAGRRPNTCLPDKGSLTSHELLAHLRAIPPAQRGMRFETAFASLMRKKYPCG